MFKMIIHITMCVQWFRSYLSIFKVCMKINYFPKGLSNWIISNHLEIISILVIFLNVNINPWERKLGCDFFIQEWQHRASLVAQWLRVCLPVQGTWVRALVWEDPTCRGAARPVSHDCWACASGACAPQQERPR